MIEAVVKHRIALAQQGGHHAQIGHVTVGKQQRSFAPDMISQRLFQLLVGTLMTADQMGGTTADAPVCHCPLKGGDHRRIIGQSKIIIAAEIQIPAPLHHRIAATGTVLNQGLPVTMLLTASSQVGGAFCW